MLAVLLAALFSAKVTLHNSAFLYPAIIYGLIALCLTLAKARCRADGREWSNSERQAANRAGVRIGMGVSVLILIGTVAWRCFR
jgi:hypothetical protein